MANAEGSGVSSFFHRTWRIVRWPLAVLVVLYIALVIYRIPAVDLQRRSDEAIVKIHAQRLTMNDVDGEHLPPPPDPAKVNATVAGVDANGNGIRDDVELAIFKKYPTSAKIRAAELQYAMELQNQLANVFSTETFVAAIQEEGRGFSCLYAAAISDSVFESRKTEVSNLVFDTEARNKRRNDNYEKYMTSFSALKGPDCDVNANSLSN